MKKKLQEATFSKLVADIDAKWGHTYEDPVFEEEVAVAGWNPNFLVIEELSLKKE
jgi:hypothetical protein